MNRITPSLVLTLGALTLAACQSAAPPNRGQSGYRLDPTHDAPGELGDPRPRAQDLVTATDRMAQDLAARMDVTNPARPPVVVVGTIENRSSFPDRNYQAFLVRLRSVLQQSGARHGLSFVRERSYVERQRDREYGHSDPASSARAYASRADYILTCELFDLPTGGADYYLFDYQLVQLRSADGGPDVGPGAIVWENMYEVKFQ